jgi:hypothetical protein
MIRGPQGPWKPVFTWKPIKIRKRWYWLTTIYRRDRNIVVYPHQGYEFGDAGDFIIDSLRNT